MEHAFAVGSVAVAPQVVVVPSSLPAAVSQKASATSSSFSITSGAAVSACALALATGGRAAAGKRRSRGQVFRRSSAGTITTGICTKYELVNLHEDMRKELDEELFRTVTAGDRSKIRNAKQASKDEKAVQELQQKLADPKEVRAMSIDGTTQLSSDDLTVGLQDITLTYDEPEHNLVGMCQSIDGCMKYIRAHMPEEDGATRVPPTCATRCARGGKTTFLLELSKHLQQQEDESGNRIYYPIFVTFNGQTKVKRRPGEEPNDWFYRAIAHQLVDGETRAKLEDIDGTLSCSAKVLRQYFKNKKDYILMIDELNMLLSHEEAVAQDQHACAKAEVSRFMKDIFLAKKDTYLIFTSHIQSTSSELSAYMEGQSSRQVNFVGLPLARGLNELRDMDTTYSSCMHVTHMMAIFYGRIPALVWSVIATKMPVDTIFQAAMRHPAPDVKELLPAFLAETLRGNPQQKLEAFRHLTDSVGAVKVRWIPCYMAAFLKMCGMPYERVAEWLDGMSAAEAKDGKAWEKLLAVAFALRYMAQRDYPENGNWVDDVDSNTQLVFLNGAAGWTSVGDALRELHCPLSFPTVQLVLPNHSQFKTVDLFAVKWTSPTDKQVVMVAQQKEGAASVAGEPPEECTSKAKAFWIRGAAGQRQIALNCWVQPSQEQIDAFLGVSLTHAAPARWRDDA